MRICILGASEFGNAVEDQSNVMDEILQLDNQSPDVQT